MILLYIDPGTGFMALQILAASFLGASFVFRKMLAQLLCRIGLHNKPKNTAWCLRCERLGSGKRAEKND